MVVGEVEVVVVMKVMMTVEVNWRFERVWPWLWLQL